VVVCTAEAEDLPVLCHRVIVMRNGTVDAELRADALTQESLLSATTREINDV
jgi:ABC-type sugar transport system ATPase subunit